MQVLDILQRAKACCAKLPVHQISAVTEKSYRQTFARLWREPTLDALKAGISLDTYYCRRAALHWGSRILLERFAAKCWAAGERKDIAAVQHFARLVVRALDRIEPAVERDPPLMAGVTPLQSPASRWRRQAGPQPRRGARSKKHVLSLLPPDWDLRVWQAALEYWNDPADQADLDTLAVALLAPIRPEECIPGQRAHGWSDGVVVILQSARHLDIIVAPAKSHRGRYGAGITTIKINPIEAGGSAAYLAERCTASGGRMVITLQSKDASRKKLARLGVAALPDCDVRITPYVCRHQVIADIKATRGAGGDVAAAAGHCTDRTQSKYGRVVHGRKRRGLIAIESNRAPRTGNIDRARALASKARRPLQTKKSEEAGV
jgi:hypothetical protein